jgi:hypothetical protein
VMEQRAAAVKHHCRNAVNSAVRDSIVEQRLDGRIVKSPDWLVSS